MAHSGGFRSVVVFTVLMARVSGASACAIISCDVFNNSLIWAWFSSACFCIFAVIPVSIASLTSFSATFWVKLSIWNCWLIKGFVGVGGRPLQNWCRLQVPLPWEKYTDAGLVEMLLMYCLLYFDNLLSLLYLLYLILCLLYCMVWYCKFISSQWNTYVDLPNLFLIILISQMERMLPLLDGVEGGEVFSTIV